MSELWGFVSTVLINLFSSVDKAIGVFMGFRLFGIPFFILLALLDLLFSFAEYFGLNGSDIE